MAFGGQTVTIPSGGRLVATPSLAAAKYRIEKAMMASGRRDLGTRLPAAWSSL
jgi:hypothetical protein